VSALTTRFADAATRSRLKTWGTVHAETTTKEAMLVGHVQLEASNVRTAIQHRR